MAELSKLVVGYEMPLVFVERLRAEYPDLNVVVCPDRLRLADALLGAQALVGGRLGPDLLAGASALRWFQLVGTGVDAVLFPELIESEMVVTNFSGIDAHSIPEHLLAMMLTFARDFPRLLHGQVAHRWMHGETQVFELGEQTLGVVGLGSIGQGLAWRAQALGMRVIGLRRHAGERPRCVDEVYGSEELHNLLAQADHVAICLPLTRHTCGLFGAREFQAMKQTAYLYNVGRGLIIDQDALIAALRAGEIAGAGLDVTTPEPLPTDSPLWDMPNVVITGHNSAYSPHYADRGFAILLANIGRYRRGDPLVNVVDKLEGY